MSKFSTVLVSLIFLAAINCSVAQICTILDPILSCDPNQIHFYLYPIRGNPNLYQEIVYNDVHSLQSSLFQPGFPTTFITHGFRSNFTSNMPQTVKNAYLQSGSNNNFILVDWGALATPIAPLTSALYAVVTTNVPIVAQRVSDFIIFLINNSAGAVTLNQLHLVGHSLGSHISGLTGLYLQELYPGTKVARITGLDPAGPLYFPPATCRNLVKTDAVFVDVIHSNMGVLGDTTEDGAVDFYPNGGVSQPGCALNDTGIPEGDPSTFGRCSHWYSYQIYAASISLNFHACPCPLFPLLCTTSCGSSSILLGLNCPTSATGKYYLTGTAGPNPKPS